VHLILSVGLSRILESAQRIGWGTLAIIALGGCILLVRCFAWHFTLGREYRNLKILTLFRIYAAAESIGFLFFGGPAVTDTTRVLMLRDSVPTDRLISSVTLDRGLYLVGSAVVLAATIFLLPLTLHLHGSAGIPRYTYIIGGIYTAIFATLWIAMRKRVRLLSGLFATFARIRPLRNRATRISAEALQVEDAMFRFLNTDRPGFWSAVALNLAAHFLTALEVLLVLWFLGTTGSPLIALFIEGMNKIGNISGAVIPGNVGAHEAANMMILKLLGFDPAVGLVLALTRDVRRIFWVGVGLAFFFGSGFGRLPHSAEVQ
jgi:hypothetical protein